LIYDLAYAMGEIDVRRLVAAISYTELVAWACYLRARNAPAERPWLRDADTIEAMAALAYG
jgi:hypothetical protein